MARKQFYNGIDIRKIIEEKTYYTVLNYSITECIKLILSNGNFYDAFIRSNNNNNNLIKLSNDINNDINNDIFEDTILFHRRLAFNYIQEIITIKIENRICEILKFQEFLKNQNYDKTCSICLEYVNNTNDDNWFISKCDHLFHKKCISKWNRNSCPLCRKRNYK